MYGLAVCNHDWHQFLEERLGAGIPDAYHCTQRQPLLISLSGLVNCTAGMWTLADAAWACVSDLHAVHDHVVSAAPLARM